MRLLSSTAALAAVLALAVTIIVAAVAVSSAAASATGAWSFASNPDLHPAALAVSTPRRADPGDLFVAPVDNFSSHSHFVGQTGPEILDTSGNPVWVDPLPLAAEDFQPQTYRGQPVLTWWQGDVKGGFGAGEDVIVDDHYRPVATVRAGNGYQADLHEFQVTGYGTAFITAYRLESANLKAFHGPAHGQLVDSAIQEIDIKTGKVLWQWDARKHIPLSDSYVGANQQPWDPYHLNSVALDNHGNVLISARNTWAVYRVSKRTGAIEWRLGGKHSSFKFASGSHFAWQHDARYLGSDWYSVFDDEAAPSEATQSRGLVLWLDTKTHVAHRMRQYTHKNPHLLSGSQGNMQSLPSGHVLVGWGQPGYLSEFTKSGKLVLDAHFYGADQTYRAFSGPWVGWPLTLPSLVARVTGLAQTTLYASWNGATQIAAWRVLAGSPPSLAPAPVTVPRTGFETVITTSSLGPFFAVEALDASGHVLGTSQAVHP